MPASEEAEQAIASVKDGRECMATVKSARHPTQHRAFWKMLAILADNGIFPTKEAALAAVKIGCGHVDEFIMPDTGEVAFVPKSIAFESLASAEFRVVMDAAIELICTRWLAGADKAMIRAQIEAVLADPAAIGEKVR